MEATELRQDVGKNPVRKRDPHSRSRLCKVHASVNPGECTACVLAAYYERQLAILQEKITMLQGTVDKLTG